MQLGDWSPPLEQDWSQTQTVAAMCPPLSHVEAEGGEPPATAMQVKCHLPLVDSRAEDLFLIGSLLPPLANNFILGPLFLVSESERMKIRRHPYLKPTNTFRIKYSTIESFILMPFMSISSGKLIASPLKSKLGSNIEKSNLLEENSTFLYCNSWVGKERMRARLKVRERHTQRESLQLAVSFQII